MAVGRIRQLGLGELLSIMAVRICPSACSRSGLLVVSRMNVLPEVRQTGFPEIIAFYPRRANAN